VFALVGLGTTAIAPCARADEPRAPAPAAGESAPPSAPSTEPARRPPASAPRTAPDEPPAVPNPSPVVIGGRPTPTDRVALPLGWNASHFATADYFIAGTAGAVTLATAILHPIKGHSLQGGIWFDDTVRNAVRSNNIQTRYAFRDASDVGLSLAATWPFFVDALATTWWYRGSRNAAQEMALLDLETLAIAGAAQGVTNVLVSRERPYGQYCGTAALPADALDCNGIQQYRSFFSGHATFTFTAAALICVNHTQNALLGSPWDGVSCVGGYVVAASTSALRVLADMHYTSDVIIGAVVGTLIGYGVPLLHFRHRDVGKVTLGALTLQMVPSLGGAGFVGTF
jgi:membrane-associated phospholipid phosphatase